MNGWIKTYRKIQEHWIWTSKEPYDMRSAWQYLIMNANYTDNKILTNNGELLKIERGQILVSVRNLSEKWKWSVSKVSKFLKRLEDDNMVQRIGNKSGTLLTIVNYSVYQGYENTKDTPNDTQEEHGRYTEQYTEDTPNDTPKIQGAVQNKESKEDNKDEECKEREKERMEDTLVVSNDTTRQTQSVRRITEKWNELSAYGIKEVSRLHSNSSRYRMLVARIKEYGEESVIKAIEYIKTSDFLQGKSGGGWQITFDWFVRPDNFHKVLEQNYDNRGNKKQSNQKTAAEMINENREMLAEWAREMEEKENDI